MSPTISATVVGRRQLPTQFERETQSTITAMRTTTAQGTASQMRSQMATRAGESCNNGVPPAG